MAKVLVVDDREDICDIVGAYLKEEGHEVTVANHGVTARRALEIDRFDAVVIDVVLPGMSGLAVAEIADARGVPVLLISGEPKSIAELRGDGRSFLQKPFHLAELGAAVRAMLSAADDPANRPSPPSVHG
jgi:DNA-binding response OmpR family regulator